LSNFIDEKIVNPENMETFSYVLILVGIVFLTVGIIIPRFRMYWLIAGLNGLSKKELEKFNLRYIEKRFGAMMSFLGILTMINPLLLTYIGKAEFILRTFLVTLLVVTVLGAIAGYVSRKKIYHSGDN
jgi:hypothetical protein